MKTCPDCGHEYSNRAGKCPNCGAPNLTKPGCGMGCLVLAVGFLLVVLLAGLAGILQEVL